MTKDHLDVKVLQEKLEKFAEERDWHQFHSPKNLAMALSVEAGELMEIFQWMTAEESQRVAKEGGVKAKAEEEIADIVLYVLRIADRLEIDIPAACDRKLKVNANKYPPHLAKGNAKKYTELEQE